MGLVGSPPPPPGKSREQDRVSHCCTLYSSRGRHSYFLSLWNCVFMMTNFLQMAVKCLEEGIPFGLGLGWVQEEFTTHVSIGYSSI